MKTRLMLSIAAFLCAATLGEAQIAPQGGIQGRPPQPKTQQPRPATTARRSLSPAASTTRSPSRDGHRMSPKGGRW